MNHFCYILRNNHEPDINRTYNGYTTDLEKRLKKHNSGKGAIYTKKWGNNTWEVYVVIKGFEDKISALQCEWRVKHPAPKRTRPTRYNSPKGRVMGLCEILQMERFTSKCCKPIREYKLEIWIVKEYEEYINNIPENIKVNFVDKIDLTQFS